MNKIICPFYPLKNKYNVKKLTNAKNITVFLNGLRTENRKITLYPKRLNQWHHILNEITTKVDPYFGVVKKLYSSESGITICSFSDIENNGTYVASDNRKFQIIKGGYNKPDDNERCEKCFFEHYVRGHLRQNNKKKKLTYVRPDLLVIYVFSNGNEKLPPHKFVLSKDDLQHWEQTLSFIALILDVPYRTIKFLYDSNGSKVCGPWELQHGASYIAVGYHERFKRRNYLINESTNEEGQCGGLPHIQKHKTLKCAHKRKPRPYSWQQDLTWTYPRNNIYDLCLPRNNSLDNSNNSYSKSTDNYSLNENIRTCLSGSRNVIPVVCSLVSHKYRTNNLRN